jgi:hypothetical protein
VGVTSVDIYLSTDGGATYPRTIATGEVNDGSYLWTVDDLDSKTARIKAEAFDAAHNKGVDAGDADFILWGSMSGVTPSPADAPREVTLRVTEGNPVTASSLIVYGVPSDMRVRIAVYDVSGRMLGNLVDTPSQAGYNSLAWSEFERRAGHLSAGIYFLRLDAEAGARSAKVVVAR